MKILQWDKSIGRVELTRKEQTTKSLVFDLDALPTSTEPKHIQFEYHGRGKYVQVWRMTWKKFIKMRNIGSVALIDKDEFRLEWRETQP